MRPLYGDRIPEPTEPTTTVNSDWLAALTAERAELQRRLDAVVAKISEAVVSDDDCVCSMLCHSAIIAIAENK